MFTLRHDREVVNYFGENRFNWQVAGVHAELKEVSSSKDGLPSGGDSCYHLSETNRVYWLIDNHFVAYEIAGSTLRVLTVKPLA